MYELTVAARATYEVGTEDLIDGPQLRRINELQHRLSAQVAKLASGDPNVMPDEVIVAVVFDLGENGRRAFERVTNRIRS